jgi:phage gp36-like protein
MPYCTAADVQSAAGGARRLQQLADWDADTEVDTAEVDLAITDAQAEVDSYASKRWKVPLAVPVPRVLAAKTAELAVLILLGRRSRLTDAQERQRERLDKWLEALATGKVMPDVEPTPAEAAIIRDKVVERASGDGGVAAARNDTAGYW